MVPALRIASSFSSRVFCSERVAGLPWADVLSFAMSWEVQFGRKGGAQRSLRRVSITAMASAAPAAAASNIDRPGWSET